MRCIKIQDIKSFYKSMKAPLLAFGRTKVTFTSSTIIEKKQDAITYTL